MNPAKTYISKQIEPYRTILLQLQSVIEAIVPNAQLYVYGKYRFIIVMAFLYVF